MCESKPKACLDSCAMHTLPKFKDVLDINDYKYQPAPEILELNNDERFKDENNNILDIEVRGERNVNNCYFRVKDISKCFEMPNLQKIIIDKDGAYEENEHYKQFSIDIKVTNKVKKELFLTYNGLLRFIYVSRNSNIKPNIIFNNFLKKNENILNYIVNNKLSNINMNSIKLERNTPGIYLYIIGDAKTLLKDDKYENNDLLCKYGKTTDIYERNRTHNKNFKKDFGVKIKLYKFAIIDNNNLSTAEYVISKIFDKYRIKYNNYNELIIIKDNNLSIIDTEYNNIQNLYLECTKSLVEENKNLKNKISILEDKIKNMEGDECDINVLYTYLTEKSYNIEDNGVDKYNIPNKYLYNKKSIVDSLINLYTNLDKMNNYNKDKILRDIKALFPNSQVEKKIIEKLLDKLMTYNNRLIAKKNSCYCYDCDSSDTENDNSDTEN